MRIVEGKEVRTIDLLAKERFRMPGMVLMENAALRVVDYLTGHLEACGRRTAILAGKGNNGGDALAVFRHMFNMGADVVLVLSCLEGEYLGDAKTQWQILEKMDIPRDLFVTYHEPERARRVIASADILVDGVFGTGFHGSMKDYPLQLMHWYNESSAVKVAVDIPSGLDSNTGGGDTVMEADVTVTFGVPKTGLYLDPLKRSGQIFVGDISIPRKIWEDFSQEFILTDRLLVRDLLGEKPADIHKGDQGKLLIAGGSPGLTGAVVLAAEAAVRAGAGLVTVFVPASLNDIMEKKLTEPMSYPAAHHGGFLTEESLPELLQEAAGRDAVVLGPGMGRTPESRGLVEKFLASYEGTTVLDADGLYHLADSQVPVQPAGTLIITPHSGEAARLLGLSAGEIDRDRVWAVRELAGRYGAVAVLKGSRTLISDGTRVGINSTGNPGLATGGSGDVLAGILGALAARGIPAFGAAQAAVFLHGLAGDLAARELSTDFMKAGDLTGYLNGAYREVEESRPPVGLLYRIC